jgi:glycosyltransferase involved in cell wall biosynthesis
MEDTMIPMWVKRAVRPLIPDALMARYRLHQHSRQVRTNVDVFVGDRKHARRWLRATPDTYRVVVGETGPGSDPLPDGVAACGDDDEARSRALRLLARSGTDAAVVGWVGRVGLLGGHRCEPAVHPLAIALGPEAAAEVGDATTSDPTTLLHRVRDAGWRIALEPVAASEKVDPTRRDSIDLPVVVVLGAVPMHDVGGGSRGSQLTQEFLRRGFHAVYVSLFGTNESIDLGLRFVHPHLEQYRAGEFDAAVLIARSRRGGCAVVEIPAQYLEPIIAAVQQAGWPVCYDIIDLWSDTALGGEWYSERFEQALVERADLVTASASDLALGPGGVRSDVVLVPNAVNATLFGGEPGPIPSDLPTGTGPLLGYHGSLYGDWFDWAAVTEVARSFPGARVVLIGDVPESHPAMPANVSFLGLKPQQVLLDYVSRFDVGLLPFVVSDTTHAVSPLKVFEYLACGVPVAAPPLRALGGLEVHIGDPLFDAVRQALAGSRPDRRLAMEAHSWVRRAELILDGLGVEIPAPADPVRVVSRPVTHYPKGERLLS